MFCLQAPDLTIVPVAESALRRLEARHRGGREGKALRIGFGRVAQALYQQPQAVAIVAGIGQCPAQLLLLALQASVQAVFGGASRRAAEAARPGVQQRGKVDDLRMGEQLTVAGLKIALAHVGLPIQAMARQFGDQHLEIAQRRREPAQLGGGPIEPRCAGAAAQRAQQAANAAQTDAQVVQRFGVLRLLQPQQRLVQRRLKPAKLGDNICDESHVPCSGEDNPFSMARRRGLRLDQRAGIVQLPPGLIHDHRDGIRQVHAAALRLHRDADFLLRRQRIEDIGG